MDSKATIQAVVVNADNMDANRAYEKISLFKENGHSIRTSTFTDPFNRMAKPFPGHLYGAYCADDASSGPTQITDRVSFTQIRVYDYTEELVTRVMYFVDPEATEGLLDYLIVAPDENGWPTNILTSGTVVVTAAGPVSIPVDLTEGIYYVALASFNNTVTLEYIYTTYNGYPMTNNYIISSYGEDWNNAVQGGLGYYGFCFIHATELGGESHVTGLTEWPTEIVPGIDNSNSVNPPLVLVRAPL